MVCKSKTIEAMTSSIITDARTVAGATFSLSVRFNIVAYASDKNVIAWGENASFGSKWGEFALAAYETSAGHLSQMLDAEHQCIGLGISGTYHSEMYGIYK